MSAALLTVEDLGVQFAVPIGGLLRRRYLPLQAVDGVSFSLQPGETLGVVGESGCGKSTLGRLLIRLIPATAGQVVFDGMEITSLDPKRLRAARRGMQIVFQDPFGALNPRMSVEETIMEPLLIHGARRDDAIRAACGDFEAVRDVIQRHVVHAVDTQLAIAIDPLHQRAGREYQRMAVCRVHWV